MSISDDDLDEVRRSAIEAFDADRHASTVELLGAYLEHRREDGFAWFTFGDALRLMGLVEEAEHAFSRALELEPDRWMIHVRVAQLHSNAGRFSDAEYSYAAAAKDPQATLHGWFWVLRGTDHFRNSLHAAAEQCQRVALTLEDVDLDEAYANLGNALEAQGRYEDAATAYQSALAHSAENLQAQKGLVSVEGVRQAMEIAKSLRNQG